MNYEYNMSERHILDLQNVNTVSAITKLNPVLLKKAEVLCTVRTYEIFAYGRIASISFACASASFV